MMPKTFFNNKEETKAFTLVEMVVVLSIIGGMLAIAVPKYTSATTNRRVSIVVQNMMRDLKEAHRDARTQSKVVTVKFYPRNSSYQTNRKNIQIPVPVRISFQSDIHSVEGDVEEKHINFYPDQSVDPFVILLSDGEKSVTLRVNQSTGNIYVN